MTDIDQTLQGDGAREETLRERVDRMRIRNDAALDALAKQGIQVQNNVHFAVLVEHLLGDTDSTERLRYELKVQEAFTRLIADVESQVARAKLLQGVQLSRDNGRPVIPGGG